MVPTVGYDYIHQNKAKHARAKSVLLVENEFLSSRHLLFHSFDIFFSFELSSLLHSQ